MKITESQLRRIIREEILKEQRSRYRDSGGVAPGSVYGQTVARSQTPGQGREVIKRKEFIESARDSSIGTGFLRLLRDIVVGMTPVGVALDIEFLIDALKSKQSDKIAVAGIAFIPGLGDAIAAPFKKLFRHFDESGYIAKNGSDDIGELTNRQVNQATEEADEIIDSWKSSGMSTSSLDEILEETGEAAVRATKQRLSIPRWGQPTTIGYHGTDKGVLRNIKENGLDNFAGTPRYQGTMMRTTSNWTYTPSGAAAFSKQHSNPVLLRFETSGVTSDVGIKSTRQYNTFKIEKQDGSTIYARPKSSNIEEFHKSPIGADSNFAAGNIPYNNGWIDHGSPGKRRSLINDMEFSDSQGFSSTRRLSRPEIDRIVKDPSQSIRGHEKSGLDFLDRIGSSSKPVPPDVIEYSLDDGKTWSHILDYES